MKRLDALALAACLAGNAHALLAQDGGARATGNAVPAVLEAVAPEFPELAVQARVSAVVEVRLEVSESGEPTSARASVADTTLLQPLFEKAAEEAALRWRFEETAGGRGSVAPVTLTFRFQAKANESPIVGNQQLPERRVVFKPPFEVEVAAAPYVCYTPGQVERR